MQGLMVPYQTCEVSGPVGCDTVLLSYSFPTFERNVGVAMTVTNPDTYILC